LQKASLIDTLMEEIYLLSSLMPNFKELFNLKITFLYFESFDQNDEKPQAGNTKEGSITVLLTSCLTGLD
jgi:hypothetical protein